MFFSLRKASRKSQCWVILALMGWAGVASSQPAYFVDGYHGGVYGHYPDGFTRFIVDTLKLHPAWKINLEIEPETWDRAKTNEADALAELQGCGDTCWGGYVRAVVGELVNWIGPDGTGLVTPLRIVRKTQKCQTCWT